MQTKSLCWLLGSLVHVLKEMEGRSLNLKISSKRRQKNQHVFTPDRKEDPPPMNTTWIKIKKRVSNYNLMELRNDEKYDN